MWLSSLLLSFILFVHISRKAFSNTSQIDINVETIQPHLNPVWVMQLDEIPYGSAFNTKNHFKGQEKWSSVRITDSKKNPIKVENHVSIHSNLNLNGLCPDQLGLGKEVNI